MSADDRTTAESPPTETPPTSPESSTAEPSEGVDSVAGTGEAPVVPEQAEEMPQGVAEPAQSAPMPQARAKTKGVADIVFLVDVSGSMATCIDALRKNIEVFIDSLNRGDANNAAPVRDWRGKVVGYRDIEHAEADGLPWVVDNPFVRDAACAEGAAGGRCRRLAAATSPSRCSMRCTRSRRWKPSPRARRARTPASGAIAATRRAW